MKRARSAYVGDAVAIALLAMAAGAFLVGSNALARSEDLKALFWLVVGVVSVRGAVVVARPGGRS
jgi:hypothetical protein